MSDAHHAFQDLKHATLIDLTREICHKMQRPASHPSVEVCTFSTHNDVRVADGYEFTCATLALHMGDHAGTHVDAPYHFDPKSTVTVEKMPLNTFLTEAVCLDLSHKPDESDILPEDLEKAEAAAGVSIQEGDTVLLYTGFHDRHAGTEAYLSKFPGLVKESAIWLGQKKISLFGVEPVSPGRLGRSNFEVHHVCRDMGFTHMEGLVNLDKLVGKGRFRFIGFPLRIKGGTGSPIRAVAWLE